jgi:hypothetical protein
VNETRDTAAERWYWSIRCLLLIAQGIGGLGLWAAQQYGAADWLLAWVSPLAESLRCAVGL